MLAARAAAATRRRHERWHGHGHGHGRRHGRRVARVRPHVRRRALLVGAQSDWLRGRRRWGGWDGGGRGRGSRGHAVLDREYAARTGGARPQVGLCAADTVAALPASTFRRLHRGDRLASGGHRRGRTGRIRVVADDRRAQLPASLPEPAARQQQRQPTQSALLFRHRSRLLHSAQERAPSQQFWNPTFLRLRTQLMCIKFSLYELFFKQVNSQISLVIIHIIISSFMN